METVYTAAALRLKSADVAFSAVLSVSFWDQPDFGGKWGEEGSGWRGWKGGLGGGWGDHGERLQPPYDRVLRDQRVIGISRGLVRSAPPGVAVEESVISRD